MDLRSRRVPPFASERRAYNDAIEKAITRYEEKVRSLNHKILTYNLSVLTPMHMSLLDVEKKVQAFRDACTPLPE